MLRPSAPAGSSVNSSGPSADPVGGIAFRVEADRLSVDLAGAPPELGASIERYRTDWEASGRLVDSLLRLPYAEWVAAGRPTYPTREEDEETYWRSQWAASHDLMAVAQEQLAASNRTFRDTLDGLRSAVEQTRLVEATQQTSVQALEQAARQMTEGGRRVAAALDKQPEVITREEQLLVAQRQVVDKVAAVLEVILKRYSESLSSQSRDLADGWRQLAGEVKRTVEGASSTLAASVDELNETVTNLRKATGPRA
jgi:hypothetical protein